MKAKTPYLHAFRGIRFCAALLLGVMSAVDAQSVHQLRRQGDAFYDKKEFAEAEKSYRKAEAAGKGSDYNLGNTLMQQERYPEAVSAYSDAVQKAGTATKKADALHNQGNAYFQMKDYAKSIDAYKQALALDAESADTRENLALAKWHLKKQQQQQEQQRQQQNNQQQKQKEDQKQPQDGDQQKQQSSGNKDQEKGSPNQEEATTPQNSQNKPSAADEKLLQLMDQEERRVQQKWHQRNGKKKAKGKDW